MLRALIQINGDNANGVPLYGVRAALVADPAAADSYAGHVGGVVLNLRPATATEVEVIASVDQFIPGPIPIRCGCQIGLAQAKPGCHSARAKPQRDFRPYSTRRNAYTVSRVTKEWPPHRLRAAPRRRWDSGPLR
jgi:hypothetical protein